MMAKMLHILSGGAAHGLVKRLQPDFEALHGCALHGTFGAVGLMKEKLLAGVPCDVIILTAALIEELAGKGYADAGSARALGTVKTGLAVPEGAAAPEVTDAEGLKRLLASAGGIYFPDPAKATAGIHFMKVLQALGLAEEVATRIHTFPNGATAMGALATAGDPAAVGCTQVTEILDIPGVRLAGLLPPPHELATVYTAAVCTKGAAPDLAAAFVNALASEAAAEARRASGFE